MSLYDEAALKQEFERVLGDLNDKLRKLRTGRARADVFETISVEAYGSEMPLKNVANVVAESAVKVVINPWDSGVTDAVLKAIQEANLGYNPVPSGNSIIINIPPLTEESRLETVKMVKGMLEDAKVRIRQVRQKYMSQIDDAEGVSEDEQEVDRKAVQKDVDKYNDLLDKAAEDKEADIMNM